MQMTRPTTSPSTIEVPRYLAEFRVSQARHLQARGRRHLDEALDLLEEFLAERGLDRVSTQARPGRGERGLAALLDALDEFEQTEFEAFEGNRDQQRVVDGALRALHRRLQSLAR